MDQSKSSSVSVEAPCIPIPKRTISVEFFVGIFTLISVACGGYLAVGLGDMKVFGDDRYDLYAEFDNVSGLKNGASVEIAGVQVGQVTNISLRDSVAILTLSLNKSIQIKDDDIALIRTKGIIGDRYVKISRGASSIMMKTGETLKDTQSVVDIEDLIGKFVHNMDSGKSGS